MTITVSPTSPATMSEFSLIDTHFKNLTAQHQQTTLGIGDDCAISTIPPNHELVSCVDTSVAGQHFLFSTSAYAIGYKSVAVNFSDLASMGATPYAILLGLSLPKTLANDKTWIKQFTQGIADICRQFNVELIGGDTTKSDILTISITALGFIPQGQAIKRQGAKVSDVVCVSGEVGLASLALQRALHQEQHHHDSDGLLAPETSAQTSEELALKTAMHFPLPQVELGQKLRGFAGSMIDISDGLGQDLGHILTASGVGAVIDLAKIPTNPVLQDLPATERWHHQVNGGDDYQLCFTLSKANFEKFNKQYPNEIFAIGEIIAETGLSFVNAGKKVDFRVRGWEHFR